MDLLKHFKAAMVQPTLSGFQQFESFTLSQDKTKSIEAALSIGLRCSNLGQAFAAGYRCALQALQPDLKQDLWAAMCVTEASGNHPKHIQTTVNDQGEVTGKKSFITMATSAKQLIVIAKAGETERYPMLKAVLVEQFGQDGIHIEPMPSLGMIPDIQHGQLTLESVQGKVLLGDGHVDYSKRFRTIEDLHVLAAFSALVVSTAHRYGLSDHIVEKGLFLFNFLLNNDLSDHAIQHLNIHQAFEIFRSLTEDLMQQSDRLPEAFVRDWKRDEKLFKVASKARAVRRERAIAELTGEG